MKRLVLVPLLSVAPLLATFGPSAGASAASTLPYHQPALMYNIPNAAAINGNTTYIKPAITPPPILACLPVTPPSPIPGCVPPAPPAGEPWPGNMTYFGGHVQTSPREYLVFWGWGAPGAFTAPCTHPAGDPLKCDPDGAGQRMLSFTKQFGGTPWAGVSTQYYETLTAPGGGTYNKYITNPANQLKGVWIDNTNPTSTKLTYTMIAQEAARAAQHFHVTDLADSNFIVAQPQNYSDPVAASVGYCAFHDYTEPGIENGIYNGITPNLSYTNMPYILNQGASCGQNAVNAGAAGKLDGESIVLGHEIEETVTDPGAEDPAPNGTSLGGWYDVNQYENGDKCAWVGDNLTGVGPEPLPVPGAMGTVVGDNNGQPGQTFPVQSLWSNQAAAGLGYCAGAGTDLPA